MNLFNDPVAAFVLVMLGTLILSLVGHLALLAINATAKLIRRGR